MGNAEATVRAIFAGGICTLVVVITLLFSAAMPMGFAYGAGVMIPFGYSAIRLLGAGEVPYRDAMTQIESRVLWIGSLIVGLTVTKLYGFNFAVTWFLSVIIFGFRSLGLRDTLIAMGLFTPMDCEDGHSWDKREREEE